jgi:hypothetical protein
VHKTIKASANGQAGWMLANHLYHQDQLRPSQATWDLLGLGNGSGTDYTGTAAQITKILTTGQNFAGVPVNPFFDNSKTSVKFSILKMIERYRTRDDNGNKLTLGAAGLGTMITTQQMLDEIDVCTPAHVVIQHGRNDLTYGSINDFITNLQTMISIIRTELPSVKIGLCLTPDRAGTYFTDRYPEIEFNETLSNTRIEYDAVKQMNSIFTDGTNGVYLIPNYYVAPTAYGYCLQDISSPTYVLGQLNNGKRYKPLVSFPNSHPGIYAHMEWAYQVYSWLKYVMAVS